MKFRGGSSSSNQGRPEPSTIRRPSRPTELASRMLRRKGRLSSTQATSEEKRFKTRPEGMESKKVTGAWKSRGWTRSRAEEKELVGRLVRGEVGKMACSREKNNVSPKCGNRGIGGTWRELSQGEKDPSSSDRGNPTRPCQAFIASGLDMLTALSRKES